MDMFNVLGLLLILLSPFCMGLPWVKAGGAESAVAKACFACVAGYFMRLTLFHAVALPMTVLGLRAFPPWPMCSPCCWWARAWCPRGWEGMRSGTGKNSRLLRQFDRIYWLGLVVA